MQKIISKLSIFAGVSMFALALSVPAIVSAESGPGRGETVAQTQTTTDDNGATTPQDRREDRRDDKRQDSQAVKAQAAQTKLEDKKLKACQNREKAINNIMSNIAERGTRQLDVFTKISERTQAFYKDKGMSVANYDELVADVNAKKTAAEATVAEVKATSLTFKCDGTDPKGAGESFKASLKAEKEALKAYKTSIKDLIKAVKSSQSTSTDSSSDDNANTGTTTTEEAQ
jgi:hypothetical protein